MSKYYSRRGILRAGAATTLLHAIPRSSMLGQTFSSPDATRLDALALRVPPDEMHKLALRAVDAARAAGAVYADVRLTRTITQILEFDAAGVLRAEVRDREEVGIGVRALVNGYWGFAASPYWEPDEATRLAQHAVSQARANALGTSRVVDWMPIPTATGAWVCPGVDPFGISVEEKIEFVNAWRQGITESMMRDWILFANSSKVAFTRQEWVMASSEGASIAQTFYDTGGNFKVIARMRDWRVKSNAELEASGVSWQRGGWEIWPDAKVRDQIDQSLIARLEDKIKRGIRPVDIGRYDVVFDAKTSGMLVGKTFGIATQLDRALGMEANAGGTSYLGPDPMAVLGTPVGSPLITVSANRSMPKGLATVQWDDEGVRPDEFPLVTNGVLVDYQTTREQAPWLKTWYEKQRQPIRSHGCAASISALSMPVQQPPNLVLQPGTTAASFEALVASTKKGYAFVNGAVSMDMQAKNGIGSGEVREIVNGKLGDSVNSAAFLFNSLEFWKNVTALGDASTARQTGLTNYKGEPMQTGNFSVSAVPLAVKNVSIVDSRRRA